jgi:hypothetical protein
MSRLPSLDCVRVPLTVGQQVTLRHDTAPWTVKATTDNFAALTRLTTEADRPDEDKDYPEFAEDFEVGEVLYTVLDWRNGVRGPCNLIGQSWGDGTYSETECAAMLAEFEAGDLEISSRNWLRLEVIA